MKLNKLSKEDWKTFWAIYVWVLIIVIPLSFVIMGVDNAALKQAVKSEMDIVTNECMNIVTQLDLTVTQKYTEYETKIKSIQKNVYYLIHREQLLEEKVAKLEAQVRELQCTKK